MNEPILDVIVVGGGYAGLSLSYYLKNYSLNHVVFERGKVGESWRTQRWDSFKMNTANKLNLLPSDVGEANDPNAFCTASEYVASFEGYVSKFQMPVVENSKVVAIEKAQDFFKLAVLSNELIKHYFCKQVIIASGSANEIKIPTFAKDIPYRIRQIHVSQYQNPAHLPNGAVLVVGGAQSGCQVAEDLANAGKSVYLSTSMVARLPRWYRGRDIMDWLIDMKFFETRAEQIEDPKMLNLKAPQLTGVDGGKRTLSLQSLAKKGIVLLGRADHADQENIFFQPNAATHVHFADEFSKKAKEMVDAFITKNKLVAPSPQPDEDDVADIDASCVGNMTSLNFADNDIHSIIWATGFNTDHSYIKLPVFDSAGNLEHKDGIPNFPGIYFVGYPWLRVRGSSITFGIKEDARFIVDKVFNSSTEDTKAHQPNRLLKADAVKI